MGYNVDNRISERGERALAKAVEALRAAEHRPVAALLELKGRDPSVVQGIIAEFAARPFSMLTAADDAALDALCLLRFALSGHPSAETEHKRCAAMLARLIDGWSAAIGEGGLSLALRRLEATMRSGGVE